MTELEKIAYTKTFIDKLANGINPLDDTQIPEGEVAANPRMASSTDDAATMAIHTGVAIASVTIVLCMLHLLILLSKAYLQGKAYEYTSPNYKSSL